MSSTRKALLQRRTATFSSPVVAAVAVVVAVAAVVAVGAAAVVAVAVLALLAAALAPAAAHPGVRAAGAERGDQPRVIDANNHGRARHSRPGHFMCASVSCELRMCAPAVIGAKLGR